MVESMQNKNLEQLHTKLRQHLENQKSGWKSFVYAQKKGFYQGFKEIGIDGARSTELRFSEYNIEKYLTKEKKALDVVKGVFSKIQSTGVQKILNIAVFDSLKFIVVYPVEDESKLTNKDGDVLPDAKLLPENSTAKDLAVLIHADIAKGFLHAIDCKTKQRIGGDHKLKNHDVIKIVSTLSRG